ncbi:MULTISPECIES: anthrone oxygenase family protein [unclassified Microcoleus]
MQSINITAINPLFMTALFGTAAACIFLIISSFKSHQPGAAYLLVGSLLYLVGTVSVTIAFNVPLNDALAKVEPSSAEGAKLWASYLTNWTIWNHIRSAAALAAAALLIVGICDRSAQ